MSLKPKRVISVHSNEQLIADLQAGLDDVAVGRVQPFVGEQIIVESC